MDEAAGLPTAFPPDRASLLAAIRRAARRWRREVRDDPRRFRRRLLLDPNDRRPFGEMMEPWQEDAFAALDPAWKGVAGITMRGSGADICRRAWIERPRGHAKTSDMAVQIAWVLLAARRPIEGVCAAADRDQARLIFHAIGRLIAANLGLRGVLRVGAGKVESRLVPARIEVISSDVGSSYGLTPDFVICDELSHWPGEGLWHSLLSSAAKRPRSVLAVLTNAGAGRGWQWQAREAARNHPDWHFSSIDGPQAPWIDPADLAEQRAMLPQSVYDRLWNNRWQTGIGNYLTAGEVAACRDEALRIVERPALGARYVAAIDYAEKHDRTAAVLLHWDSARFVVDRLDVAAPRPGAPVLVSWVDDWITRIGERFPQTTFVVDEHQLLGTLQRLGTRYRLIRFAFAGGMGNHDLAIALRHLVIHRQIAWYPKCGSIAEMPGDDLESELADLILKESPGGRLRFDAPTGGHDDRAFVLAVAAHHAQTALGADPKWQAGRRPGRGFLTW